MAEPPAPTPDETAGPAATVEITVGKVGRAHGLRGDVFVEVRTDDPDLRFSPGTAFTTPRGVLVVESTRWHGARFVVRFAEVGGREAAERLRGVELTLVVPEADRPDDPEEFYDHQLRGLAAHGPDGEMLGRVTDVLHLPAQDTLVLDVGGREVLVPFVSEIVPVVDLAGRRVEIADRPGLLAEAPADEPGG